MKKTWIKNILTVFFLAIFVYAAGNLFLIWQEYRQSDALYREAQTEFLMAPAMEAEFIADEPVTWPAFSIDFAQLQSVNSEVKGWIWIYDTVVNYPLVQSGRNNDAYLHKTYDGTSNSSGSIFMDYRNTGDFSDDNTVIYGHNYYSGGMFTNLHYFEDETFFKENEYFYIYTPDRKLTYSIVSAYKYDDRHILNSFDFIPLRINEYFPFCNIMLTLSQRNQKTALPRQFFLRPYAIPSIRGSIFNVNKGNPDKVQFSVFIHIPQSLMLAKIQLQN